MKDIERKLLCIGDGEGEDLRSIRVKNAKRDCWIAEIAHRNAILMVGTNS